MSASNIHPYFRLSISHFYLYFWSWNMNVLFCERNEIARNVFLIFAISFFFNCFSSVIRQEGSLACSLQCCHFYTDYSDMFPQLNRICIRLASSTGCWSLNFFLSNISNFLCGSNDSLLILQNICILKSNY